MTIDPAQLMRRLEWPDGVLRVNELEAAGWRPTPFGCFVVKLHSRCNLACDYCYLYEMADQSWRDAPKIMSDRVIDQVAVRIAEHARTHGLPRVTVVLHGGEPLLAGARVVARVTDAVRRELPGTTEVDFVVQTNGVLLDEPMLDVLGAHGVKVGVSIDGDAAANDRHRRFANGKGSHESVARGIGLLRSPAYRHLYQGLLCTVDIENDPVETFHALLEHEPPGLDFLLPHGNWTTPPPGWTGDPGHTPYADWLIAAFDAWYGAPVQQTWVRLFGDALSLLMGGGTTSEQIGIAPAGVVVVETDGSLEQVDTLKSTYDGATETGLTVFGAPFDAALRHPSVAARQLGVAGLSDACRACPERDVCGGGYYTHRYREGEGFLNPTVYCADMLGFVAHVRGRLTADVQRLTSRDAV
ncbi:FxsB family cyclophane-forming radical SAM/SPASM peptide maturase [Streptomyces avicenniae]|uniref:FxsB family cyclophane-forming radical SAM/SPASM peptide maturase n=1 Tax=Streptomyces avicenniae TaxID=500153 RepID=UPI000B08F893|nr:FxsB family cyclophane-forming radical SAM/SPASM peptide maturase [Streptomyces avicenniae]